MSRKNLPKNSRALAATLAKKNGVSSHFFYSATLYTTLHDMFTYTPTDWLAVVPKILCVHREGAG